ncbi:MAG: 3-deoxy-7-phosphoheptulonate synthase [Bacteroidetes bacterium]|nr:3-deoxy-7-phosphoheptulonate synthase [Bacteroidota bacterium]
MIIVMKKGATKDEIESVATRIEDLGFKAHLSVGEERTIIGIIGDERPLGQMPLEMLSGVERIVPILQPFKLASRDFKPQNTVVEVNGVRIGGKELTVIAGPCSVESREQLWETARAVKTAGAKLLRGGAFKPRTSPYSFQGLGVEGLKLLAEVRDEFGLAVVTEIMSPNDLDDVCKYADVLQIGARNMANFSLLREVGASGRPVLLKRGMSATIQELIMAAEYILAQRNYNVVLCERGIRTFETATRFTLDINAIPVVKQLTHLPIIVDPSHGTGKWDLVAPVAKAAIAAGADGLIVEVHPHPDKAMSDGAQSLRPDVFAQLMQDLRRVAESVDRKLA